MLAGDVIRRRVSADALHFELLVGHQTRLAVSAQRTSQTSRSCALDCANVASRAIVRLRVASSRQKAPSLLHQSQRGILHEFVGGLTTSSWQVISKRRER